MRVRLAALSQRWVRTLARRQCVEVLLTYAEKSEEDVEREARLVEQWVGLTEERNAVLVPAPGSGIPGAPADW